MKSINISTKDGTNVTVYAFDNVCFETTIFPHNIGHDCMAFVVHQLGIKDARYFGFRYITKGVRVKWINLDQRLGKQLDKHCKEHRLYFGVMYYVSRAYTIQDLSAQYQYFRQLHIDYLYNPYECSLESAIKLASFYLRVILGPYDPQKHEVTSLNCHELFPASIRRDEKIAADALLKAFQNYKSLAITSKSCMSFYIIEFECATYYGLESYPALLSETGQPVHLLTSYNGILIKYLNSPNSFLLKWSDIVAVTRSQRSSIITQQPSHSIQLKLDGKKSAQYFFQMAFLLMKFYQDNLELCDRSSKEPAQPDGYESYSLLLSNSQSEAVRAVFRYRQSLTSIPENLPSCPKVLHETAPSPLARTSPPEQTALGAIARPPQQTALGAIARPPQVSFPDIRTTDTTTKWQPLTNVERAEIRLNQNKELFFDGAQTIKYEAKKFSKGVQTQSSSLTSMINERFQKYTDTSPVHLLSQTLKNILRYLDEIEKEEHEAQVDYIKSKRAEQTVSDSQPLQKGDVCDKPHKIPYKSLFPKAESDNADLDHTKPITVGQILSRVKNLEMLSKSTGAVSPAKSDNGKESNVSETQTVSPRREYVHLNQATYEPCYHSLSKSELLALESSKGAVYKQSTEPFIKVASNAFKEIRNRDKYECLQRKLNEGQVFTEFDSTGLKSVQMPCSIGNYFDNAPRNRYIYVPYDENRVQVSGRPDNVFGYINASSIKWRRGPYALSFIAAQAPLKNTVEDFWQMVWEQKVSIVIMLSSINNEDPLGCCQYWPQETNPGQKFQCGPFTINFHTYRRTSEYCLDILTMTDNSEQQLVSHLYFDQWSADDCPTDLSVFVSILEEIESLQNLMRTKDPVQSPIVVMCHDGVGRTGVLIMSYIMKLCLKHDLQMNLQHLLGFLRSNRMFMVTSQKQYISVYEALIYLLKGLFSPSKSYLVGPFRI